MRLHRRGRRGRHRVDVERAVRAEGRALGLSHGPRRDRRHDDSRRPDRRDAPVSHGHDGRRSRGQIQRSRARTRTRLRPRASARAAAAIARGAFTDEIVAVPIPQKKGEPRVVRRPTSIRARARPPTSSPRCGPAFKKDGAVTAGNASGINDGAAAVVVCSNEKARGARHERGSRGSCRYATTGVEPMVMGIGPVSGRAQGARARRARRRRTSTSSSSTKRSPRSRSRSCASWVSTRRKVNVNGGAIALGHPIGASGARDPDDADLRAAEARRRPRRRRLCIGGGMGIAMVIEV